MEEFITKIKLLPQKSSEVILCCCVLHNIIANFEPYRDENDDIDEIGNNYITVEESSEEFSSEDNNNDAEHIEGRLHRDFLRDLLECWNDM